MWISFSVLCSVPLTFMSVLLSVPHSYDFCCSVPQLCLTPCDPIDCSTLGFPVLHYLLKFAQINVHWVIDAIQPSHLLLLPCPSALSLSQHQAGSFAMSWLFESGGQSSGASVSASVLPMNIQGSFPLELTGLISLKSKGLSRVFTSTIIWKHPFFWAQSSLWSNSHMHTWLLEKP